MRTLVVYESWFGNTQRIAEKVAAAVAPESEVEIVSVNDPLPSLVHVDLVVLGAPTHVHGLSSARSRQGAIDQRGDGGEPGIGARDWIDRLPPRGGPRMAVFDTRATSPNCSSARPPTGWRGGCGGTAMCSPSSPRASS